jgi:hypothetical protein
MPTLPIGALWRFLQTRMVPAATSAEACSGTITAEEALKAEEARYAAQMANDFAAMERLFGDSGVHHSARWTPRRASSSRCARAP